MEEHRRLLDAADHLPVIGGRCRDRRRYGDVEFLDERPRRKGYRPWRNRAIVYTLIETGMRRAEVTSIDLQGSTGRRTTSSSRKRAAASGSARSQEGLKAIKDYLKEERGGDATSSRSPRRSSSPPLPSSTAGAASRPRSSTASGTTSASARVKGHTPHSARHAMGVHYVEKTGNPRAAQQQLGHKNPSTTMQYMQFSRKKMKETLNDR